MKQTEYEKKIIVLLPKKDANIILETLRLELKVATHLEFFPRKKLDVKDSKAPINSSESKDKPNEYINEFSFLINNLIKDSTATTEILDLASAFFSVFPEFLNLLSVKVREKLNLNFNWMKSLLPPPQQKVLSIEELIELHEKCHTQIYFRGEYHPEGTDKNWEALNAASDQEKIQFFTKLLQMKGNSKAGVAAIAAAYGDILPLQERKQMIAIVQGFVKEEPSLLEKICKIIKTLADSDFIRFISVEEQKTLVTWLLQNQAYLFTDMSKSLINLAPENQEMIIDIFLQLTKEVDSFQCAFWACALLPYASKNQQFLICETLFEFKQYHQLIDHVKFLSTPQKEKLVRTLLDNILENQNYQQDCYARRLGNLITSELADVQIEIINRLLVLSKHRNPHMRQLAVVALEKVLKQEVPDKEKNLIVQRLMDMLQDKGKLMDSGSGNGDSIRRVNQVVQFALTANMNLLTSDEKARVSNPILLSSKKLITEYYDPQASYYPLTWFNLTFLFEILPFCNKEDEKWILVEIKRLFDTGIYTRAINHCCFRISELTPKSFETYREFCIANLLSAISRADTQKSAEEYFAIILTKFKFSVEQSIALFRHLSTLPLANTKQVMKNIYEMDALKVSLLHPNLDQIKHIVRGYLS